MPNPDEGRVSHRADRRYVSGVTVIICTYNGAGRLPLTLAALRRQLLPKDSWDLVIVDNASTDNSTQICRELWAGESVPMRILREAKPGVCFARETGIRSAQREFICVVDDDNSLCPTYLSDAVDLLKRHPDVAILGGQGLPIIEGSKPSWIWREWRSHGVGPQAEAEGYVDDRRGFVYTAGMVIRQSALEHATDAGYCPLLGGRAGDALSSGDDVELCFALRILGWKIYYSPRLEFEHYMSSNRLTWEYCQRLFTGFGEANAVLDLYQPWLSGGRKAALKRNFPGALLHELLKLRRLTTRVKSAPPSTEGDAESLFWHEAKGKRNAIWRHLRSGRFFDFHRKISRLARHAHRPQTP